MAQGPTALEHHNLVRDTVKQPKPGPTCLSDIRGVAFNMHFLLVLKDLHQNTLNKLLYAITYYMLKVCDLYRIEDPNLNID